MKHLRILNDKSKRLLFKREELKKKVALLLDKKHKNCSFFDWKSIKFKNSSSASIKNYCILSGRPRGLLRDFKLSRILIRKMGSKGLLSGLKKNSW